MTWRHQLWCGLWYWCWRHWWRQCLLRHWRLAQCLETMWEIKRMSTWMVWWRRLSWSKWCQWFHRWWRHPDNLMTSDIWWRRWRRGWWRRLWRRRWCRLVTSDSEVWWRRLLRRQTETSGGNDDSREAWWRRRRLTTWEMKDDDVDGYLE